MTFCRSFSYLERECMEKLRLKIEEEAEKIMLDKRVGFPLKAIMKHVMEKAGADEDYKKQLFCTDFGEILVYIAEYLIKEIVESEESFVPDEVVYNALDRWILEEDKRSMLLEVVENVKHPQMKNRNPFFESGFLSKANLEKLEDDFKKLPAVAMLIRKYHVESESTISRPTKTMVKKKEIEQPSLLAMMTSEEANDSEQEAISGTKEEENSAEKVGLLEGKQEQNVTSFIAPASKKKIDGQMDLFSML